MTMLLVFGIVAEVADEVAPAHVEHRADGHEGAEADHFPQRPVEHGGAEGAGLADEGDVAAAGDAGGEGGVDAADGVHHAEAVRADEAHVAAPGMGQQLALELDTRRAGFLEARGNDDRAGNAEVGGFADDARDDRGGGGDDDEVGLLRQVGQLGIGLDAQHAGPGGVDRVDRAAERRVHQVPQHGAADAADLFGGADHGDRFGHEDGIQGMPADLTVRALNGFWIVEVIGVFIREWK